MTQRIAWVAFSVALALGCTADKGPKREAEPARSQAAALSAWHTAPGTMLIASSEQAMTLLSDGRVLACGGVIGATPLNLCMVFDPELGTWDIHSVLASGRRGATATTLPSGAVLLCGGGDASCETLAEGDSVWSPGASMSAARTFATATLLRSGRVLIAGGDGQGSAEVFDPSAGVFQAAGSIAPRAGATATRLGDGRVLVAGGVNGATALANADVYDPVANQWSATSPLPQARSEHSATRLRTGKVLVAGGRVGGAHTGTALLYDEVNGTWTALTSSMAQARGAHSAAMLPSGKVLVAGGSGAAGAIASAELFDPLTQTFSSAGSLASARTGASALVLRDGSVLIAGGGDTSPNDTAEVFASSEPAWSVAADPGEQLWASRWTRLPSGKLLVSGGLVFGGTVVAKPSLWAYDSQQNKWQKMAPMVAARADHSATLLLDGRVLLAGGDVDLSTPIALSEVYDPVTDSSTAVGAMPLAVWGHTAVLLPDGSVMTVCGTDQNYYTTQAASRFDPASGTWSALAPMLDAHYGCVAVPLASGKVLVTGGGAPEVYDPATNQWSFAGAAGYGRYFMAAARGANGRVLLVAGLDEAVSASSDRVESFDPETNDVAELSPIPGARSSSGWTFLPDGRLLVVGSQYGPDDAFVYDAATDSWEAAGSHSVLGLIGGAALLPSGKVLAGDPSASSPPTTVVFDRGLGVSPAWKPVISSMPARVAPGTTIDIVGTRFRGNSEAYGGTSSGGATDLPLVSLVALDGLAMSFLPVVHFDDGLVRVNVPLGTPRNHYSLTVIVAGIPSDSSVLLVRGANGDLCDAGAGCRAGNCVDGTCCAASACGACEACNLAGHDGTCASLPQGTQNGACADPLACDGAGQCLPKAGESCSGPSQCSTGHCADGVCCESSCDAPCMACDLPGSAGECKPLPATAQDSDPAGACDAPNACNGLGACKPGPGVLCATEVDCGTGYCVDGVCCDAACNALCYSCAVPGSEGICALVPAQAEDAPQCDQGRVCDGAGQCRLADAQSCADASSCASGFCPSGVCCDAACDGICWTCALSGTEGSCRPTPKGASAVGCGGPNTCDGAGACKLALAQGCDSDSDCASAHCADGVCCDSACQGQCEACDVPSQAGTCLPIDGAPRKGRLPCDGPNTGDPCTAKSCDGAVSRTTCAGYVGVEQACRTASCTAGVEVKAARCNGNGACGAEESRACQLYVCGEQACKTSCQSDVDCASPDQFRCDPDNSLCVPREGTKCEGDHGVLAPDGGTTDCSPYRCESGASGAICKSSCSSTLDCVDGYVCDKTQGQGVCAAVGADAPAQEESSGGCGCTTPQRTPRRAAVGVLALALALGLSWRRRPSRLRLSMHRESSRNGGTA